MTTTPKPGSKQPVGCHVPNCPVSEVLQERIGALRQEIMVRLEAGDKAVDAAAGNLSVRLDHANGVVKQMMDFQREMRANMVQAVELASTVERLAKVEQEQARCAGQKKGHEPLTSVIMIVVAAAVAAIVSRLT
jgi:hypothetical protein